MKTCTTLQSSIRNNDAVSRKPRYLNNKKLNISQIFKIETYRTSTVDKVHTQSTNHILSFLNLSVSGTNKVRYIYLSFAS